MISREYIESVWLSLAGDAFLPAKIKILDIQGAPFKVLFAPGRGEAVQDIYIDTGLSLFARPRFASYPFRFVLIPIDAFTGPERWEIIKNDIKDFIIWANHIHQIVLFSTLKSGAAFPFKVHAQSIPFRLSDGTILSALADVQTQTLVDFDTMHKFLDIKISKLLNFPSSGILVEGRNGSAGIEQVAKKIYELALNYDHLKAYNFVVFPSENDISAKVFFFPRRKDGKASFGEMRWQVAAFEISGLIQTKLIEDAENIDVHGIVELLQETAIDESQFGSFLNLIDSF